MFVPNKQQSVTILSYTNTYVIYEGFFAKIATSTYIGILSPSKIKDVSNVKCLCYVILFLTSRCIPHSAGYSEGTWKPSVSGSLTFLLRHFRSPFFT